MSRTEVKYAAIIMPLDDITNRESVLCQVHYLTGAKKHRKRTHICPTRIFQYYFYGVTIEVVTEVNDKIVNINDLTKDDIFSFKLGMYHTLALNIPGKLLLASNGFVYRYDQSTFARGYVNVMNNMYLQMLQSTNFDLRIYTLDGEIIYMELGVNVESTKEIYKYCLSSGFVAQNRDMLKCLLPNNDEAYKDSKEKLTQKDIDKLLEEMLNS